MIAMLKNVLKLDTDFKELFENHAENMGVVGLSFEGNSYMKFGFVMLLFAIGLYGNVCAILYTNMDVRQIIINICHIIGIFMSVLRYFHFLLDKDSLKDLIEHGIRSTSEVVFNKGLELELQKKFARITRLVQLALFIGYRIILVVNATVPLFFIKWFLMAPILLPGLDIHSHPGFEIVFVFYGFFYHYMYFTFHLYESYFFYFSFVIITRSNIFCELASNLGDLDSTFNTQIKQKKLVYQLCVLHRDLSSYTVKFVQMFAGLAFGTGMVSLFFLTMAMYIRNVDPMYSFTLVGVTTSQFLLLCIFGELILQESYKMARVIYSSQWYNVEDIPSRKLIGLLLLRSQAYNQLSAYGLYDMSMETFSKFVQKAYSFYALLRKMS